MEGSWGRVLDVERPGCSRERLRVEAGSALTAHGFPKAARLRARPEYLRVQQGGRKLHGSRFLVVISPAEGGRQSTRLGITVSSKVGNAVVRNRIKRVVREAFRLGTLPFPAASDVVVIAKPGDGLLTLAAVQDELARILARVRR